LDSVVLARHFHENLLTELGELSPGHTVAKQHPDEGPQQMTEGLEKMFAAQWRKSSNVIRL
jgi:hypothetical protein